MLGQSFTTDVTVTHPAAGGLSIAVSNLGATLRAGGTPFLTLADGAGTLTVGPTGVRATSPLTGSVTLSVPGATLDSGVFTLSLDTTTATPTFAFSTTNASLTVGGVTLSGGMSITRAVAADGSVHSTLTLTEVGASLGGLLTVAHGNGTVSFGAGGLVGSFSAQVAANSGSIGLATSATVGVDVDTAAGKIAVKVSGFDLTVAGLTVHADLGLTRTLDGTGAVRLGVTLDHATLTLPGVTLTDGTGSLTASGSTYAGSFSGHVSVSVPNVSLSGTLAVDLDTAANAGAGSLTLSGTGLQIDVAGQHLSGDLVITSTSTVDHDHRRARGLRLRRRAAHPRRRRSPRSCSPAARSPACPCPAPRRCTSRACPSARPAPACRSPSGTTRVSVTGATLLAGGLSLRADLGLTTSYDAAGVRTLTITLAQHTGPAATTSCTSTAWSSSRAPPAR